MRFATIFRLIIGAGMLFPAQATAQDGENLARSWCASCHDFPEPNLLDSKTWIDLVLPEMGARLGFQSFRGTPFHTNPNAPDGTYPATPSLEADEWEQIISWYETTAPTQLEHPDLEPRASLTLFTVEYPEPRPNDFPTSTAILIDEASNQVLVGDSYQLNVEVYDNALSLTKSTPSGGAISRIKPSPTNGHLILTMGGNIGQTEIPLGLLINLTDQEQPLERLIRRLHRPVDMITADWNADGKPDYAVAGFGAYDGKLTQHLSQTDGSFAERILLPEAGATSLALDDNTLLALMAQGNERIIRVSNLDQPQPQIETLLSFPPSYGSTSISLADIDADGQPDIIYTAGDNADISSIFKPYHGVYVFTGQGDGTYKQTTFFPMDGAYGAVAKDFDQDGDIDIAAVAYFGDIEQGLDETSLVYLENNAGDFSPKHVKGLGQLGRYIAISAGDLDGDGDHDIALANMAFGPYGPLTVSPDQQDEWLAGPRFVLLRNGLID